MLVLTCRIEQSLFLSTRHGAETLVEKAKSGEWGAILCMRGQGLFE